MTRIEFGEVIAYITAGCGKNLSAPSLEVYFDCLNDLSRDALHLAAKRVLMEHVWATFPSVAELRKAATETRSGSVMGLAPGEAWELAWKCIGQTDPEVPGDFQRAVKVFHLPPLVVRAIEVFGLHAMCFGKEPVGVVRGQFLKIYEQLAARESRTALYPASLTEAIEGMNKRLPSQVQGAIASIGNPS